jgi:hypothetical protein
MTETSNARSFLAVWNDDLPFELFHENPSVQRP